MSQLGSFRYRKARAFFREAPSADRRARSEVDLVGSRSFRMDCRADEGTSVAEAHPRSGTQPTFSVSYPRGMSTATLFIT